MPFFQYIVQLWVLKGHELQEQCTKEEILNSKTWKKAKVVKNTADTFMLLKQAGNYKKETSKKEIAVFANCKLSKLVFFFWHLAVFHSFCLFLLFVFWALEFYLCNLTFEATGFFFFSFKVRHSTWNYYFFMWRLIWRQLKTDITNKNVFFHFNFSTKSSLQKPQQFCLESMFLEIATTFEQLMLRKFDLSSYVPTEKAFNFMLDFVSCLQTKELQRH